MAAEFVRIMYTAIESLCYYWDSGQFEAGDSLRCSHFMVSCLEVLLYK